MALIIWLVQLILVAQSSVELPSSCLDQSNGYHWLKPLDSTEYPPIYQKCDNEYMIIDLNRDQNVRRYFSSYDTWHYAISGPSQMDPSNWEQWWLPNQYYLNTPSDDVDTYYTYILSPDCNSCDISSNNEQNPYSMSNDDTFGDRTAYYMTGTMFGCLFPHKALRDCTWDHDTYQCQYCTLSESDGDLGYHTMSPANDNTLFSYREAFKHTPTWNTLQISLCGVYPQSTYNTKVPQTRDQCNAFQQNIKPSIGNDGRFCMCVKPPTTEPKNDILASSFEEYKHDYINQKGPHEEESSIDRVIKLFPSDFIDGTYRITQSGTYRIMSDIEFDFNAGDLNDPNEGDAWWPRSSQSSRYPGAHQTRDEYFMGFFAGITVEADDVIIDLNGFEIRQSLPFYYQQRFFSCIALKSVAFNLNEGPGIFGTDPRFSSNVLIKNGQIGLSSHHGIHGQNNHGVTIENVHVHSFETHGIEMTYFNDLTLKQVEIGPSSDVAYLKGEYAYARFTLQRLERIQNEGNVDLNEDVFPIEFDGREETMEFDDVIQNLRHLMDIAFKSVMKIQEYDANDEDYIAAKSLFINSDGVPYGAVMYGLFLNLRVANVFQIHPSMQHSHNAIIHDLKIHDLHHKTMEYLRLDKFMTAPYKNPYNAALDATSVLGDRIKHGADDMDWSTVKYIGDPLIDAHIVLSLVTEDWGEKGMLLIDDEFSAWAQGYHTWSNDEPETHPYIGCNGDRMTHVGKGVMGIRMDGIEHAKYKGLEIYNLFEYGAMGSDLCSSYWDGDFKRFEGHGHFLQNVPYLYGYTGNMAHGIYADWSMFSFVSQINIHDIYSSTGLVRGIGLYTSNKLTFMENEREDEMGETQLNIFNLGAGMDLYEVDTTQLEHPYAPTVAKPFHVVKEYVYDERHTFYTEINDEKMRQEREDVLVQISCVFGRDGMENDYNTFSVRNDDACDIDAAYKYKTLTFASPQTSGGYASAMIWLLFMVAIVFGFVVMAYLVKKMCKGKQRLFGASTSEHDPLLSKHFSHYYGAYS